MRAQFPRPLLAALLVLGLSWLAGTPARAQAWRAYGPFADEFPFSFQDNSTTGPSFSYYAPISVGRTDHRYDAARFAPRPVALGQPQAGSYVPPRSYPSPASWRWLFLNR